MSYFEKVKILSDTIWAGTREKRSSGFANNTGIDQAAHPGSLIRAFVISFLQSNMCKFATGEILIF